MYYKTAKDSTTGKKFAGVYKRGEEAWNKRSELVGELMEKYPGMTGRFWDLGGFVIWGGLSSVEFQEDPKSDFWANVHEKEYIPLESTEEGKEIRAKFDNLPVVKYMEINECLNHKDPKNVIGFKVGEEYFGFEIHPDWKIEIPEDCEEITGSEFQNL